MLQAQLAAQGFNSLRSLLGHKPGVDVPGLLRVYSAIDEFKIYFEHWKPYVQTLAKLSDVSWAIVSEDRPRKMVFAPVPHLGEVGLPVPEAFDLEKLRDNLKKKLDETSGHLERKSRLAQDLSFREKASQETREAIVLEVIKLNNESELLRHQINYLDLVDL